jgi:hypothetical protein
VGISSALSELSSSVTHTRGDGKRFVVRADEKLTGFVELEAAIHHQLELG